MSSASFWAAALVADGGFLEEEVEGGGGGFEACKDSPKAFQSTLDEGRPPFELLPSTPGVAELAEIDDEEEEEKDSVVLG